MRTKPTLRNKHTEGRMVRPFMRLISPLLAAIAVTAVGGCGQRWFADRATNPVVEDYVSRRSFGDPAFGMLSGSATRRTILVEFPADKQTRHRICAEPPPDAVEAYANALSAAIKGVPVSGGGTLGADAARSFATEASPILYRTQGLQLLRDSQYHLCTMHLNGVINEDEYRRFFASIVYNATWLIDREMPALAVAAARTPVVVGPTVSIAAPSQPPTAQPAAEKIATDKAVADRAAAEKAAADKVTAERNAAAAKAAEVAKAIGPGTLLAPQPPPPLTGR